MNRLRAFLIRPAQLALFVTIVTGACEPQEAIVAPGLTSMLAVGSLPASITSFSADVEVTTQNRPELSKSATLGRSTMSYHIDQRAGADGRWQTTYSQFTSASSPSVLSRLAIDQSGRIEAYDKDGKQIDLRRSLIPDSVRARFESMNPSLAQAISQFKSRHPILATGDVNRAIGGFVVSRDQRSQVVSRLRERAQLRSRQGSIESYEVNLGVGTLEYVVDSATGVLELTQRPNRGVATRMSSEYAPAGNGASLRVRGRIERGTPDGGFMLISETRLTNIKVGEAK